MKILYATHWLTAWLVLVMGMYVLIRFVRGHINNSTFTQVDARMISRFSRLLDIQALLGFSFFLWGGIQGAGFPMQRIIHGILMLIAVMLPHFSTRWRDADDSTRFLNIVYLLLASFLIMLLGLSVVPA
jgi:hypothetical protein